MTVPLTGQLEVTVNSLADDADAHPYDDPQTMEDESIDGICSAAQGRCTLRAALEEASYLDLPVHVTFSVTGILAIDPLQGMFTPTDNSLIQGYEQNVTIFGDGMNTPVLIAIQNGTLISGLQFTNALIGILVTGTQNRIGLSDPGSANYISDMFQNGILITGDSNRVTGNVIGLDVLGMPESNGFGVFVTGSENVIGGDREGEGNVISGNVRGISMYAIEGGNNYILGNYIGTDISGTQARGNTIGIDIIGPNVVIGLPDVMHKNVISGNTESGVLVGIDATSILISDNLIGTDKNGTGLIPNRDGITLGPGSDGCFVQSNLIRGNTQAGILISGLPDSSLASQNHLIQDNTMSENGTGGILLTGSAFDNIIGSSLTDTYAANSIHNNGQAGVLIGGGFGNPARNTIRENHFMDNNSFGIRILSGQAGIQPPGLTSFTDDGQGTSLIIGTHALEGATIDVYSGDPNQSLRAEGLEWLGSGQTDATGYFAMTISSCPCDSVVSTATDVLGNTSEFSEGWGVMTSAVQNTSGIGNTFVAYPNPTPGHTIFELNLKTPSNVLVQVFDLSGRLISTVIRAHLSGGKHEVLWNLDSIPDGVYFCTLTTDISTHRQMMIKQE
jgi:hypothetical protein